VQVAASPTQPTSASTRQISTTEAPPPRQRLTGPKAAVAPPPTQPMPVQPLPSQSQPLPIVAPPEPAPEDDKPRGFWGSLFKRKR
jgi:hypothetical protein